MPWTTISVTRVGTNSSRRMGAKKAGPMVSGGVVRMASSTFLNVWRTVSSIVVGVWPLAWSIMYW